MAYKKPEIVAKSAAKQSFVAGCMMAHHYPNCTEMNKRCETGGKAN